MTRGVLVDENNVIHNVIISGPGYNVPSGLTFVPSEIAGIGWTYDGSNFIEPSVPEQPATVPDISALQMLSVLAINGTITEAEALNRATLPASFAPALSGMNPEQQKVFRIRWANFTTAPRNDPMIATLGAILGLNDSQIDALFIQAAAL